MSAVLSPFHRSTRSRRTDRLAERRRLKRQDALSARLAELHAIRALLGVAVEIVEKGWVQGAWFTVDTPQGRQPVTAYDLGLVEERPVPAPAWSAPSSGRPAARRPCGPSSSNALWTSPGTRCARGPTAPCTGAPGPARG